MTWYLARTYMNNPAEVHRCLWGASQNCLCPNSGQGTVQRGSHGWKGCSGGWDSDLPVLAGAAAPDATAPCTTILQLAARQSQDGGDEGHYLHRADPL